MQLDGTIEINGETTEVTGWRGMLGHNWGTEHARRWIWLRGAGFSQSPSTWLDVVIGRVRLGPLESPWIASGVVSLAGERHSVGGVGRRPVVRPRPNGAEVTLRGPDLSVQVSVEAPLERCVGWEYADPSGDLHHVRNCSSADMRLEVQGAVVQVLTSTYGAVYELGTPSRQPGLTLQPFPDT